MLSCSNGTAHKKSLCLERREVTDMNNSKSMSKNVFDSQRSVAIDFLRVIAIVAVVCVHSLPVPIISGGGWRIFASAAIGSLSKIGVPLFLIITGYLMLDRDYSGPKLKRFLQHNYLPLLVSFEAWACIAMIAKLAADPSVSSIVEGLRTMLLIGDPFMIHFWYMQMLLGIYLFIPILASFIRSFEQNADKYIRMIIVVGVVFTFVFPTIQMIYNWLGGNSDYEMTLGGFTGRGALGILYMLLGYAIKKDLFNSGKHTVHIPLALLSLVFAMGLSSMELSLTKELFLVTAGFFPIALAAFAFANWMIHTSVWHHCPVSFARALQCLAGYAFGIYMVHPLVHEVLSKLIPQGAHSVRIISLNPITIFLISLCCCILLARIKPFRKWLLLRK